MFVGGLNRNTLDPLLDKKKYFSCLSVSYRQTAVQDRMKNCRRANITCTILCMFLIYTGILSLSGMDSHVTSTERLTQHIRHLSDVSFGKCSTRTTHHLKRHYFAGRAAFFAQRGWWEGRGGGVHFVFRAAMRQNVSSGVRSSCLWSYICVALGYLRLPLPTSLDTW